MVPLDRARREEPRVLLRLIHRRIRRRRPGEQDGHLDVCLEQDGTDTSPTLEFPAAADSSTLAPKDRRLALGVGRVEPPVFS
jgi:hypothetical protein